MKEIRAMSPGKLGHGCDDEEISQALAMEPDFIGVDAGSTDMGAFFLGSGELFFHPLSVKRDLILLLRAACHRKIPLIVGNVLTTGSNAQLEKGMSLLREVAREENLEFRAAVVWSEQRKSYLHQRLRDQSIAPLGAQSDLTDADIDGASTVVAQMGLEPIVRALDAGAQVVVAGRACDDALFAAVPVREGFDQGLALHMGKILECGSMSCVPGDLHGSLVARIRQDHFVVEPASGHRVCTVHSVASHTLYERSNPYTQPGPGGINDLSETRFEQVSPRSVGVSGSKWLATSPYKVKLEAAKLVGYRAICMTGVRDPILICRLDDLLLSAEIDTRRRFGANVGTYRIIFRQYGKSAVMGDLEPDRNRPSHEIGLLIETIADSQELADAVCGYVRGTLQHAYYPGILATAGNLAYPFSPFVVPCGPAFQFCMDHLLPLSDPCECFPMEIVEVGGAVAAVP